eukprot:Filipodium_phascolosomae@DN407_c0_g1_i1.p1
METPKQIPAEAKKPATVVTRLGLFAKRIFVGPGFWHSIIVGAAAGTALVGVMSVAYPLWCAFASDTYVRESRCRYEEKQRIFQEKLRLKEQAQLVSQLAKEYNPVATTPPFQPLDPKYLL